MVLRFRDKILAGPAASRPLTRDEMHDLAKGVDLDELDLGGYRCFRDECYARNTVVATDHFELVVICWKPGQASAVHDHGKSHCLYLIVSGDMTEELYEKDGKGPPRKTRVRNWSRGTITISAGTDIHRIANHGSEPLTTIHIYSPPLGDSMTMFTPIPRSGG